MSSSLVSAWFAVHVVRAQLRHRRLEEAGELEHGGVFLVPADIAPAVPWPSLVDRAASVITKELAGAETGLDALAVLIRAVALLVQAGLGDGAYALVPSPPFPFIGRQGRAMPAE